MTERKKRKGYWKSAANRRNFFIEFASQKGFDPFVHDNWDNVTYKDIHEKVKKIGRERKKTNLNTK